MNDKPEISFPYSAINFPDGTSYTSQEVTWVLEDYQNKCERAIVKRRKSARYQMALYGTIDPDETKNEIVELTDKEKFLRKVKACNDYNWIVAVAIVRNEFDPMHSLRVRVMTSDRVGGSTLDIMTKHIDDVLRNTQSTYADRARAKDYIKFIEDMGKKWSANTPTPQIPNINLGVAVKTGGKDEPPQVQVMTPVKGLNK